MLNSTHVSLDHQDQIEDPGVMKQHHHLSPHAIQTNIIFNSNPFNLCFVVTISISAQPGTPGPQDTRSHNLSNWPLNSQTLFQCLPQPSTASVSSLHFAISMILQHIRLENPPEGGELDQDMSYFPPHILHVHEMAQLRPLQFVASRKNVEKHLDQCQHRKRGFVTPSYQAFKPELEYFTHLRVKIAVCQCEKLFELLVWVTSWHPIKSHKLLLYNTMSLTTALRLYVISSCSKVSWNRTKKCENNSNGVYSH